MQRHIGNAISPLAAREIAGAAWASAEKPTFTPNRSVIRSADFHNASVSTFSTCDREIQRDVGTTGETHLAALPSCRRANRGDCHAAIYSPWRKFPRRSQRRNSDRPHCRRRSVSGGNSWSRDETLDHHPLARSLARAPNKHCRPRRELGRALWSRGMPRN